MYVCRLIRNFFFYFVKKSSDLISDAFIGHITFLIVPENVLAKDVNVILKRTTGVRLNAYKFSLH